MSDDKYTRYVEDKIKNKYLEREREDGEVEKKREKKKEKKTLKSRSRSRRKEYHKNKKYFSSKPSRRDSKSRSRSRSRSHSHHHRKRDYRHYSRSKSPYKDNRIDREAEHNRHHRKKSNDERIRSRSKDKRHRDTHKHNIKKSEEKKKENKSSKGEFENKNLHIDENSQLIANNRENDFTSPTIDNFDFSLDKKQEDLLEKRREERKRKIEEMKLKFTSDNKALQSENIMDDKSISGFKDEHFHMSVADTTKLLKILEEEREKNLKEEINQLNEQNKNKIPVENLLQNSSLNHAGEKTPIIDMFSETPVDEISENKNMINLPLYDSNEDQTGYYTPKLNELLNDHYKVVGLCGKGIFSNVVKVVDIKTNKEFAIKILRSIDVMLLSGEKERNLLKKFNELDKNNRSNIIRLIDTFDFKRHICMVFDLYEMNLRDLLKSKGIGVGLPLNVVRTYAQQLLFAFDLIHKYKIIHADCNNYYFYIYCLVKPDNAVVNKMLDTIKLCDFGSALQEDEIVITSELVSRYYRPPEIFLGCPYDTKIDIWSLGCTLFELYTGKILFPGRNNNEMIKLILQTKGKFSQKILKRGQYSNLYFTESGNFLSLEIDPYTKKEYIKEININQFPSRDLLSMLKSNRQNLSAIEEKNLNCFKDFLEKCLHLDANKRFNALDALTHEFIGIMPTVNLFSIK